MARRILDEEFWGISNSVLFSNLFNRIESTANHLRLARGKQKSMVNGDFLASYMIRQSRQTFAHYMTYMNLKALRYACTLRKTQK